MTSEIYESSIDVLNGLWKPFGRNVSRFLARMESDALPVVGRVQPDQARQIYDAVFKQFGEEANDIFGSSNANVLEDGLGVWISWKNDEALNRAVELAPDYGISLDPDMPNIIEPLGLRNNSTPYEIPGVDVSKYSGSRGSRMADGIGVVGNTMDSIMGALHYDRNWRPENTSHPGEMYVDVLGNAVDAGDPGFLDWFNAAMDLWMGESSEMRQQFFYDLLASNPDAWADWIHECIGREGERPSDVTTVTTPPTTTTEVPTTTTAAPPPTTTTTTVPPPTTTGVPPTTTTGVPPTTTYMIPPPTTTTAVPPTTTKPFEYPPVPVEEPEHEEHEHGHDQPPTQHPLNPEAWDRRGLGFLRWFTPDAVEEWLMDHYNRQRREERHKLGEGTQWDPEEGWDTYWDNKWAAQEAIYDRRRRGLMPSTFEERSSR